MAASVMLMGQTRFASAAAIESTLTPYHATYKHSIPQRALKHQTQRQTLKAWCETQSDWFVKNVYAHSGLDNQAAAGDRDRPGRFGVEAGIMPLS